MKILNMYDFFQNAVDLDCGERKIKSCELGPYREIPVPGTPDVRLYSERGELIAYCKRYDDDLSVNFINYLRDGRVWRRETFDSRGFLSKVDILEKKDDGECETSHESYFRPDGSMAITKHSSIKNGLATTLSVQLLNKCGRLINQFKTDADLMAFWLETVVRENDGSVYVVDRCAEFFEPLRQAVVKTKANSRIIPVIHSVHTGGDILAGSVNPFYRTVLEEISAPDSIVVFTDDQKNDIIYRFGLGNLHVIPHSHEIVENVPTFDKRNRFKIVYLARYTAEKNHNVALDVFRLVVNAIPNAELHLYGFGEKKSEIINKINEMNLSRNVFVNDFICAVGDVYQEAGLSILTSSIEGFCLGVQESLFHGCPVVSFDIRYGPRAMIANGINGFLVPPMDVNLFAEKIISILSDENLHRKLINSSAESMRNFSHEVVASKWATLLPEDIRPKPDDRLN